MHGSVRLFLATLVVLAHLGHPTGIHVGACAVVVFYMLAGYVVTNLLQKHFPPGRLFAFYGERFLRIYPLYLVILLLASAFLYFTQFQHPVFTPYKIVAHLTIIPLNFYMFWNTFVVPENNILPPAWSLGAELQAYAVLPHIIRSGRGKWIFGLTSLAVFTGAALSLYQPDIWGYRLLAGSLFIFLTGSALCQTINNPQKADDFDRLFPIICWTWLLFLLAGLSTLTTRLTYVPLAVMVGYLIGLPLVQFTSKSSWKIPRDALLGSLSYGLFLVHMPVAWFLQYRFGWDLSTKKTFAVVWFVSLALAYVTSQSIERLVWPLRRSLTQKSPARANHPA